MDSTEKAVWGAIFAQEFAKDSPVDFSVDDAIERADFAVSEMRERVKSLGRLHGDNQLENERRVEKVIRR